MEYQIIPDFLHALGRLSNTDQKRVRKTIDAISTSSEAVGLRTHKINHPSKSILSYSVSRDIRVIAHRHRKKITLLYVGHHDAAYAWIERRRVLNLGTTLKIILPKSEFYYEVDESAPVVSQPETKLISEINTFTTELKSLSNDDQALRFIESLQADDSTKLHLLDVYLEKYNALAALPQHLVKVIDGDEQLSIALKYPLDHWRVFLHPLQSTIVDLPLNESRYITGGPGTGKTVCLVHRIKRAIEGLSDGQQVLLITYREQLFDFLAEMMMKLNVDRQLVRFVDVNQMSETHVVHLPSTVPIGSSVEGGVSLFRGCFVNHAGRLYYFGNSLVEIVHVFVDEFQDFPGLQLDIIQQLSDIVPYTISVDYSQAIYRPPRKSVTDAVSELSDDVVELSYCYRLNYEVIPLLKRVMMVARIVGSFGNKTQRFSVLPREERVLDSLRPAIKGPRPRYLTYDSGATLSDHIASTLSLFSSAYAEDEIVVTSFIPEVYKHGRTGTSFGREFVPVPGQRFYRCIYTLKGLEWKVGIVVLDDVICSLLNLNNSVFVRNLHPDFKGANQSVKRMFNLLYVALSRFRDHLYICYPAKYETILGELLG